MKSSMGCKTGVQLAGGFALAVCLVGCAMNGAITGGGGPVTGTLSISGAVHGGEQGISGSAIQLWAVGTTGYGSAASPLLSAARSTNSAGGFNITADYTCPSASSLVYITAAGGDPGIGKSNSAIKLAAALGACGNLSSSTVITINEVTTAATAYALGQYFTTGLGSSSTDSFGYPGSSTQALTGITNAFATVNSLVNSVDGTAVTTKTLANGGNTITTTPEAAKLYTIADILASCVNSDGSATSVCQTTLFPDVNPTGGTQPTDTLQAAVDLSLNPTSNNANGSANNMTALYALQTPTSPFVGVATQPTDWTLGILYSATAGNTSFLVKPQNIAVDGGGNVWVLSNSSGLGDLAELSPTGTPLADPQTLNILFTPTGGTQANTSFLFATTSTNPRNIAIDTNNNVWFTASSSATDTAGVKANGAIFEYQSGGGSTGFSTGKGAYGVAIDGANDVFVGQQSSSAVYELYELPAGNVNKPIGYPIATATAGTAGTSGTNTYIAPENLAFDPSGNLWMTGGISTSNFAVELTHIAASATIVAACDAATPVVYPCAQTTSASSNTYNTVALSGGGTASGLAADTSSIFITEVTSNGVSKVPYATPATNTLVGSTATFTTPHFDAVDGAGNVWVSNQNGTPAGVVGPPAIAATPGGSISEISAAGVILSPSTSNVLTVNPGFVHSGLNAGTGIAVDPSGNVWVANNAGTGTDAKSVFELVGAAAPTVTPIATALANNAVGAKP